MHFSVVNNRRMILISHFITDTQCPINFFSSSVLNTFLCRNSRIGSVVDIGNVTRLHNLEVSMPSYAYNAFIKLHTSVTLVNWKKIFFKYSLFFYFIHEEFLLDKSK